jgi:XTP/dITP diphosphohydrolase
MTPLTRLVLATTNEGKVAEFRRALTGVAVVSAHELGVGDFPEETGGTYAANALTKASFVMQRTGLPSLADDSGLEVDALGGAPGLYSARFGGLGSDAERTEYLLAQLQGVPEVAREAAFVCVLGFVTPDGDAETFEGRCQGRITEAPRGTHGHGYDPVFFSPELAQTFAEAPPEAKAQVSHRARALAKFSAWLAERTA